MACVRDVTRYACIAALGRNVPAAQLQLTTVRQAREMRGITAPSGGESVKLLQLLRQGAGQDACRLQLVARSLCAACSMRHARQHL